MRPARLVSIIAREFNVNLCATLDRLLPAEQVVGGRFADTLDGLRRSRVKGRCRTFYSYGQQARFPAMAEIEGDILRADCAFVLLERPLCVLSWAVVNVAELDARDFGK